MLDKETPPNSPPVTISICDFQNVSTSYIRTELTHLANTRAVFPTGVLISEVGKLHSQFIDQRTSLPVLLERSKVFSFNLIRPKKIELCDQITCAGQVTPSQDECVGTRLNGTVLPSSWALKSKTGPALSTISRN